MSIRTYDRTSFEVTLVPGASNQFTLVIDLLDEEGDPSGPLLGSDYELFFAQATEVPSSTTPRPLPLLYFSVVHLPGFIPPGDASPHEGSFLLQMDPTDSAQLQDSWIQHGIVDMFGVKADGQRDYLASGNFTTHMVATRVFA